MSIKIGGREVDIKKAIPLTIRDWKQLKERNINLRDLSNPDVDTLSGFLLYLVQKVDPGATQEEVDALAIDEVTLAMKDIFPEEDNSNRPT